MFLLSDVLVDVSNRAEFKHRCRLLQLPSLRDDADAANNIPAQPRSRWFYWMAHCLANGYVVVLECGRLWGHIVTRKNPWRGICRRFDWHCGRLEKAPWNFRKREAYKFGLFVVVTIFVFGHNWRRDVSSSFSGMASDKELTCITKEYW